MPAKTLERGAHCPHIPLDDGLKSHTDGKPTADNDGGYSGCCVEGKAVSEVGHYEPYSSHPEDHTG